MHARSGQGVLLITIVILSLCSSLSSDESHLPLIEGDWTSETIHENGAGDKQKDTETKITYSFSFIDLNKRVGIALHSVHLLRGYDSHYERYRGNFSVARVEGKTVELDVFLYQNSDDSGELMKWPSRFTRIKIEIIDKFTMIIHTKHRSLKFSKVFK